MRTVDILYEDDDIFVVVKPPGMPSQPERSATMDMVSYLKNLLASRDKIKNPYVSVVHRLDRPVGGIMVYGKNQKAAAGLSAQIAGHRVVKEYMAVVWGQMSVSKATLEDYMIKDASSNMSRVVDSKVKGAKKAVLSYELIDTAVSGNHLLSLLKIRLETGRHHQIRVQLSHGGHPVAGDHKYGRTYFEVQKKESDNDVFRDPFYELGLFSCTLEFNHPVSKKRLRYEARPFAQPFSFFDGKTDLPKTD